MGRKKSMRMQKEYITSGLPYNKQKELTQLIQNLLECASVVKIGESLSSQWENHKQIRSLLEQIINIQMELQVGLPERNPQALTDFVCWATEHGVVADKVSIAEIDGYGYSVLAKEHILTDESLISVPRSIMLTTESIETSSLKELFESDVLLQQMPNVALALLLIVERFKKDSRSFWAPYLNVLPSHYSTPLYYSLEDLEEIKASPIFETSLKLYKSIARQYAYFWNIFMKKKDPASLVLKNVFTYEQYRWAVATVMTRQNYIPSKDHCTTVNALIPFWDMCNHAEPEDGVDELTTSYNFENDSCICDSFKSYAPGEQVFIYYGMRSNFDFVVHNGFCYPPNKLDVLGLKFGVARTDPFHMQRANLMAQLDVSVTGEYYIKKNPECIIDPPLIAFLRIFKLTPDYLEKFSSNGQYGKLKWAPLFDLRVNGFEDESSRTYLKQLDIDVLKYLRTRMEIIAKSYPTTIEKDKQILEEGGLSNIRKVIITQRMLEKQILLDAIAYCTKLLDANKLENIAPSVSSETNGKESSPLVDSCNLLTDSSKSEKSEQVPTTKHDEEISDVSLALTSCELE